MFVPASPQALVASSPELASLPAVVMRVAGMLANEGCSPAEIGAAVAQDPALTARLLKIVNSPYYGLSGRIDTVSRAVMLVGIDVLYTLVLTTSVMQGFKRIPPELANMNDFWRHSLYCGEIARVLAKEAAVLHGERLFVAGLLHRVGSLIFYMKLPEASHEVLLLADGDERLVPELERQLIGFTYADAGAELARSWKLPLALSEAIHWQLEPERAGSYCVEASLVYLAQRLKSVFLSGADPEEAMASIPAEIMAWARLEKSRALQVLANLASKLEETAGTFLPSGR